MALFKSDEEKPDQINARILREMWDDWEQGFKPFEELSRNTILDPEQRRALDAEALANSQTTVDTAFNRAENRIRTLAGRLPQATDPQVQQARDRQLTLARRGAKNEAFNQTQQALQDREMERLT